MCRVASGWRLVSTQPALNGYYGALPYVYQDLEKQMRLTGGRGDTPESISGFFSLFNDLILRHTSQITLDSSLSVLFEQKPGVKARATAAGPGRIALTENHSGE